MTPEENTLAERNDTTLEPTPATSTTDTFKTETLKTETLKTETLKTETFTTDALAQVRDDNVDALVRKPLTRDSLARAKQHLNLRHPNTLFLLFRWLLRGSLAISKHEASKRIDYGSKHDLTLTDGAGDSKVSVPVNYAVGVSVFFPMAALLVWLFTKVSDYDFAITEGYAALTEGSSAPELSSQILPTTSETTVEGAP